MVTYSGWTCVKYKWKHAHTFLEVIQADPGSSIITDTYQAAASGGIQGAGSAADQR